MAEYQITYWRELPSLVVAREGGEATDVTKSPLASRFQEAIDEAAMRVGDVGSDVYLEGWRRSEWQTHTGSPLDTCEDVVSQLERQWSPEAMTRFLDSLGPGDGAER